MTLSEGKHNRMGRDNSFIKFYVIVINLLFGVASLLPEKVRNSAFRLCVLLITGITVWRWLNIEIRGIVEWKYVEIAYIILFVVLLITSIDHKVSPYHIKWHPIFWVGWYLCFIFIFITSFFNMVERDYFIWSILSLLYFPALFIVWQYRDNYIFLFRTIAWAMLIWSYVYIILSLLGAIVFTNEFEYFLGIAAHTNSNGMLATGFFAASIYLLFDEKKLNGWALFSAAASISLAIEAFSRTAILSIIIITIIGCIYYLKIHWKKSRWPACKKILVSAIIVIIISVPLCAVLSITNEMDITAYAATGDIYTSETYNTLNAVSSGRLEHWRYFTEDITLFGHGIPDMTNLPDDYRWAHNNLVDVLYISGVLAAIGYLIWILCSLWFVVRCIFSKSFNRPEYLFVIVSIIGYFVEAMLEITIYPMTTGIVFMTFMALPLISGQNSQKGNCTNIGNIIR